MPSKECDVPDIWSNECNDLLYIKPQLIFSFDQLRTYMGLINGEHLKDIPLALSPLHMLCLNEKCRSSKSPVIKLRTMNSHVEYIRHLKSHTDCDWSKAVLYRLNNTDLLSSESAITGCGVDPSALIKESVYRFGFKSPKRVKDVYVHRDTDPNTHYLTPWINLMLMSKIIDSEHLMFQSLSAILESFLHFPHALHFWSKYKTCSMYGTALNCSLTETDYNNVRGQTKWNNRKKDEPYSIQEFKDDIKNINLMIPSLKVSRRSLIPIDYGTYQLHPGYTQAHFEILKEHPTSVFVKSPQAKKHLVVCLADEQGLSQNTYEHVSVFSVC